MVEVRQCPQCGAALPVDAPSGLCPRCLLQLGLGGGGGTSRAFGDALTLPPPQTIASAAPAGSIVRYFGDYEILEEIARGGMGVVLKARQSSLDRIVALKMILAGRLASEYEVERFYTEARAAANLQHPNIVSIHEVGEHNGQHYFSMDFVDGQSLAAILQAGPLPANKAAGYLKVIADAIDYAHQRGILHRDLKPSNILIDRFDQPRVTDFGIAKRIGAREIPAAAASGFETPPSLTAPGDVLGTPSYMSPEQVGGDTAEIGPAADIYSLGAVLYELLTGRPPFRGKSVRDTLLQVIQSKPVPLRRLNRRVPAELEQICLKCLRKDPLERYSSAAALADDLERFLLGQRTRAAGEAKGRRAKFALGCGLVTLLLCGGLFLLALNLVRWGKNQYERERTLETELISLAGSWQAPADRDPADLLFPTKVGDFKRVEQADNATVPELRIDLRGRRARYESPQGTVELFLLRVAESRCEEILQGVEAGLAENRKTRSHQNGSSRVSSGDTVLERYSYSLWEPDERGSFLWCSGWLLLARTTRSGDPDEFLKAYLQAGRRAHSSVPVRNPESFVPRSSL